MEIVFDYKFEKPEETVEGMQKLHDFEFIPYGSIRVWRTFGIILGKVISKYELEKYIILLLSSY